VSVQPQGHAPTPPDPESADLFDYALVRRWVLFVLRAPLRHKLLSLGCFGAVVAAGFIALQVLPKRYVVQTSVLAQRSAVMGSLSNPFMNREQDTPTRAARELVLRRENLVSLCRQTDFVNKYLASRAPAVRFRDWLLKALTGAERSPEVLLEGLVDGLEMRLWVSVSTEGTVTIGLEWSDPELAYQMVSAAMQSFLEARHASEISIVSDTVTVLEAHAARLQNQMEPMVAQLEEKERRLRIATAPRRLPVARPRLSRDEDLVRVESTLAARRRALQDLEEFRQRRLAELQSQLGQQLTLYAAQHPSVVSTRQNIESVSAPSPQIEALRLEVRDLEREISRRGGTVPDPGDTQFRPELEFPLRSLEDDPRVEYDRAEVRLLFRQYSSVIERLDAARVELDTARAAFKHRYSVISPPQMPKHPIRPNGPLVLAAAVVGGIALAFFASTLIDIRSGRVVESWQLERRLGLRVIAEIRR
jgi:uncharacterized protein involved in exopolysaccharide biosynthesis